MRYYNGQSNIYNLTDNLENLTMVDDLENSSNGNEINNRKRKRSLYTDQQLNESPGLDDTPSVRRKSLKRARHDYLDTNSSPKTSKTATEVKAILSDLVSNNRSFINTQ